MCINNMASKAYTSVLVYALFALYIIVVTKSLGFTGLYMEELVSGQQERRPARPPPPPPRVPPSPRPL
ncbi:hypothetical protein OWV82_017487 [Melia azedarach]|uniref:Uncharacterized protein n=1 Tax=Melia azedarach TaxID=155640 RepID=A0ACC1XL50_MELAZ|nr:hypothetical protein OWV82_017487 [Melia azedarach]